MDDIKDLVIFTFTGQKVKCIFTGLDWTARVQKSDHYYENGYSSLELKDASTVNPGDTYEKVKELWKAQR